MKTAVVFLISTIFPSGEGQEEERDTRCMITELKEAAASNGSSHSSLHSSTSSSTQGKSSGLPPISHPPNSLFTSQLLFVLSSTWSQESMRNRHVHCFVVLFDFYLLFSIVRFNLVGTENHVHHFFSMLGDCAFRHTRDHRKRPNSCYIKRRFRCSSISRVGISPLVSTSFVKIHIHAANSDPTLFSSYRSHS